MKIILGILGLIIGIFGNFLIFNDSALNILTKYNINIVYVVSLSILSICISMYNLGRRNSKILNIFAILANLIFLGFFYYLESNIQF